MAKFSIIVPVYKVEKYLSRCIDSLVNQTMKDIEIILVDDGSPDECPSICDSYASADARIKVIHKENGGISAARNDGLAIASGEFVIFCDSDDWMELDACENLYNEAIRENVDVVVADINRITDNNGVYNSYFPNEFIYRERRDMDRLVQTVIYQGYCYPPPEKMAVAYGGPWNKAVRRELLINNNIKFDTSLLGLYDDTMYTLNVYAVMKSVSYIHRAVYNYVLVQSSITRTYKENSIDISERVFTALQTFINKYGADGRWDRAFDAFVVKRFEETLRMYFFSKRNPKKRRELRQELGTLMKSEPYKTSAQNVELDKLMRHHRRAAKLMRFKSVYGLEIYYCIKGALKKI